MSEQQIQVVFLMLYEGVAVMSVIACCYLLFRRGNAFSAEVTSPVRLRRWTRLISCLQAILISYAPL